MVFGTCDTVTSGSLKFSEMTASRKMLTAQTLFNNRRQPHAQLLLPPSILSFQSPLPPTNQTNQNKKGWGNMGGLVQGTRRKDGGDSNLLLERQS